MAARELQCVRPREVRVVFLHRQDVVRRGEHQDRKRQVLGVVHRIGHVPRHAREQRCREPPGPHAEEPPGHQKGEDDADPSEHGVHVVAHDPEVAGNDMLRRGRQELDEQSVDARVSEVQLEGTEELCARHAAVVEIPDQLAELLQRALVPGRAEIARQRDHRDEQRQRHGRRRCAHEKPMSTSFEGA